MFIGCIQFDQELASIDEAPLHPETRTMTFRAVADTSIRGAYVYRTGGGRLASGFEMPAGESIAVPLVPPGSDPRSSLIPAWVVPEAPRHITEPLDAWFAQVEATFDGTHTVRLRTLSDHPDSHWRRAVRDAEERFGVRSDPEAAVFVFEPGFTPSDNVVYRVEDRPPNRSAANPP